MKVKCNYADRCDAMYPKRRCGATKVHDSRDCEPCPFPEPGDAKCVETYDSLEDTVAHKHRVQNLLASVFSELTHRGMHHDDSKLKEPEKTVFDEMTPKLKGATYGSDEYKGFLKHMKVGLDHHYSQNRHHPEHFEDGISRMNLVDLIEMLADWKAASERHDDGNIYNSIMHNKERFSMPDWLVNCLLHTAEDLGWWDGVIPEICEKCKKPFTKDQDFIVCPKCREEQDGEDQGSSD
jgi:hypothetical protein